MESANPATALRTAVDDLNLSQSSFADLLCALGDHRDPKAVLRAIQRMVSGDARVSGEMRVILTLLQRERARARRIADATDWQERSDGLLSADIQGVRLTLAPQSKGRWSIHARQIADDPDGYSPAIPHWRSSLEEAKIRAVFAVDETLDHIERSRSEPISSDSPPAVRQALVG